MKHIILLLTLWVASLPVAYSSIRPIISTDNHAVWYKIRFVGSKQVVQYGSTVNAPLTAEDESTSIYQHWKLVKAGDGLFFLMNRLSSYVGWNGANYIISSRPALFQLKLHAESSDSDVWEIVRAGTHFAITQGNGGEVTESFVGTERNALTFILQSEKTTYHSLTAMLASNASQTCLLDEVAHVDLSDGAMRVYTSRGDVWSNTKSILLKLSNSAPTGIGEVGAMPMYQYPDELANEMIVKGLPQQNVDADVFTLDGRKIITARSKEGSLRVNVGSLPSGYYILYVVGRGLKFRKK